MPVLDLYSYRKRIAEDATEDVFTYDELPPKLRVQIVHIWRDAVGRKNPDAWKAIHEIVAREHGVFELADRRTYEESCETCLLRTPSIDMALDLVELSFRYIDQGARNLSQFEREDLGMRGSATDAIDELNERFRRAGVGYQFDDGRIFRVDSDLMHREVVRPALRYLHEPGFAGPREEFLRAHGCYRAGDTKEAVTNANNAFESTLKTICNQRGWEVPKGARASELLKVVRANGLLPDYLDASFDQLAATLKSGLPKVRGQEGAHGQGAAPRETPNHVAAFALHLAAAKILFLVEAHKAMK